MITAIKGMNDVLPFGTETFLTSAVWTHIHNTARDVWQSFGYHLVWLPVVEETGLFLRGIGADTDIVSKEMYTFADRGDRSLTLRPEGTAGAARAYIEHHLAREHGVQRWWYQGPMYRAERPQKGRYRQFYQIGAEFLGVADVAADVEMMVMLQTFLQALELKDVEVRLNSLGDAESRSTYRNQLLTYLRQHRDALCASCQARMEANPLRVLDCKREGCRAIVANAPDIIHALTPDARAKLDRVMALLQGSGVPMQRDPRLVRGLDYYTGAIFEFTTTALGAQNTVLGGGRYDTLVEDLGGPSTPAVGFAAGVERLALLLAEQKHAWTTGPDLYIIPMQSDAVGPALKLAMEMRAAPGGPWTIETDLAGGRLKQQMRRADRVGAKAVIVLGPDELASGQARIKDLRKNAEHACAVDAAALHKLLADL